MAITLKALIDNPKLMEQLAEPPGTTKRTPEGWRLSPDEMWVKEAGQWQHTDKFYEMAYTLYIEGRLDELGEWSLVPPENYD